MFTAAFYWIAWWLYQPLNRLIRYRTTPSELASKLALDPARPVVYVLAARSWGDLFLLDRICRDNGLPRPGRTGTLLPSASQAGALYLPALLETRIHDTALTGVVTRAAADPGFDCQVVPVSAFWGRDPGQETSLWKLIFADSVQAGMVRKLIIMLVNGRNVYANFGLPLSFRDFIAKEKTPDFAVRKLGRLLHIYFLHARTAALGPTLQNRDVVIQQLLNTARVKEEIAAEARRGKLNAEQAAEKAQRYAEEIAADYSATTVRFLERIFEFVWNRIFRGVQVFGMERLRETAQGHEIIYLPSHRSHADYLLLSYVLYQAGLVPPHIAAGVNLNFWPAGPILRRGGAFYMRRSFGSDRLYTAVFRAYVDSLIGRGYSISFYPEGTRSRTGRLLAPKAGLLGMVIESALRQSARKVAIVPVYVGYDKVWELSSYFKELRGAQKQKESASDLLKGAKLLTKSYGRVHINFGEPMQLQEYADKHLPGWRDSLRGGSETPPGWRDFVNRLGLANHRRINAAAVASPVSLAAVAMLASPQRAVSRTEFLEQLTHLVRLLEGRPYGESLQIPEPSPAKSLEWAAPIARIATVPHPWGDLLDVADRDAVLLTYARNNIQHLFAVPSLIANLFRTRGVLSEEAVVTGCRALYPFLRTEFYLRWEPAEAEQVARDCIEVMLKQGLLLRNDDGRLARPGVSTPEFSTLAMLGRVMGETLERYCMTTLLLADERRMQQSVLRDRFEEDCRRLAERMGVLTGRDSPEFFDKALFRGYLDTLIDLGIVVEGEDRRLLVDARIERIAERSLELLSDETRQTLLQLLTRRPQAATAALET
ncbi:MAG: plsB [Hydrocarboniphaga sp.]|uniref:glycerol-3-phosphate 1-O-acyltransferase PlsB n=1 Tax=Hydrocarboniphaga sp. TaxID=2033016 RepID=UPI002602E175|nr:glycerol-3-phosphate 1-O-acyltransferase PlsB [Hydrocarboniphaga sp.]MDB5972049.1 plsB [Hydrocarboniphaga sp.]